MPTELELSSTHPGLTAVRTPDGILVSFTFEVLPEANFAFDAERNPVAAGLCFRMTLAPDKNPEISREEAALFVDKVRKALSMDYGIKQRFIVPILMSEFTEKGYLDAQ